RDVPALGYVALAESERPPNPPRDDGAALEAQAGAFHVVLDPASGAIRSLTTGDGVERVRPADWSGLNQLVYVQGGAHSALWTGRARDELRAAPDLTLSQAELGSARRERLPSIGTRLVVERKLQGCTSVTTVVTLYDIFRGVWRRKIEPDGTLFAYVLHNYWPANFAARQGGELSFRYRISSLPPGGDVAEPARRGWAACDPLYVSAPYASAGSGSLPRKDSGLFIADQGVAVVGVKPADDRTGVVLKLVDPTGVGRAWAVWPAAYRVQGGRRTNFVEMNGDRVPVAPDGHATIELPAWGTAALP